MHEFRKRLKLIIGAMAGRVVTPGDVVSLTGLPRYEVLATFHVLEALGIIEPLIEKGNYRVYRLTKLGMRLLRALEAADKFTIEVVESGEAVESSLSTSQSSEGEAVVEN